MITREQVTFTAQGDSFRPSLVGAPYSEARDPGIIGDQGRYKGAPVPYGAADFDVPEEEKEKIAYLHRIVVPLLGAMRSAGADDFRLHITYHYDYQCALGFSAEEMKMIAEMDCVFAIDCWTADEPDQTPEPESDTDRGSL